MRYYYSTVEEVILTYTDIEEKNYLETITLHFEKPNGTGGFNIAEFIIPTYEFTKIMGFTEDESFQLERYAKNNAPLIWELAMRKRGAKNA